MPQFVHVHDLIPPDPPDACELAVFPVAVVPYALAALEHRIPKYVWADGSYVRGVQLIRSLQMAILCGGMKELIESNDRIYRMLDSAIFGRVYTIVSPDPLVVTPAIGAIHALTVDQPGSILGLLDQIKTAAASADGLDPELLAKLGEIAVLLA